MNAELYRDSCHRTTQGTQRPWGRVAALEQPTCSLCGLSWISFRPMTDTRSRRAPPGAAGAWADVSLDVMLADRIPQQRAPAPPSNRPAEGCHGKLWPPPPGLRRAHGSGAAPAGGCSSGGAPAQLNQHLRCGPAPWPLTLRGRRGACSSELFNTLCCTRLPAWWPAPRRGACSAELDTLG